MSTRACQQPAKVRESALKSMVKTFFDGSAANAATALLGLTKSLSAEEAAALRRAIDEAQAIGPGGAGMTTLEFFAEMGWKSALIAAAALGFAAVLRSRAASDRALVLRIGVAMLLLLPLIALGAAGAGDRRFRRAGSGAGDRR